MAQARQISLVSCAPAGPVWPGPADAHEDAADRLANLLGDHHDLAVFRRTLDGNPGAFGSRPELDILFGLVRQRQAGFEARAHALGGKVLAETASAFKKRWEVCWALWRQETGRSSQSSPPDSMPA